MIRVTAAPEPAEFDERVRRPGSAFLNSIPAGTKVNFRGKEYWRRILRDLHDAYGGICAYTCHYIPLDTGGDTVEHFEPKSLYPAYAYEWSNYRFVCGRLNGRKGDHGDVVDPFHVTPGMFELLFPSLLIREGSNLAGPTKNLAKSTIRRLKLNHERNVGARLEYVLRFRDGKNSLAHLSDYAPFIFGELNRQGITRAALQAMMPQIAAT